ncbi:MAG: hypothetical protein FJ257_06960 [Phycisphaerae bacterium]|nr:hypothetical protein [Phycisphaerae bacterium]
MSNLLRVLAHGACRVAGAVLALGLTLPTLAQSAPSKPRLAIRSIEASAAVMAEARAQGQQAVLAQVLEGADGLLVTAISRTGRFDLVARRDLPDVLREQDLADSGNVDPNDPQTARSGRLAGAAYLATVTIENFQQVVRRGEFDDQFGRTAAERRSLQILATVRLFDTTTGVLAASATIPLEESVVSENLPGVAEEGRPSNILIGRATDALAQDAANQLMNWLAPAKVLAYTSGVVTLNRGAGTGIRSGQFWQVLHAGDRLIDPETGEDLGAEEIPIGWARITEVSERTSRAEAIVDFGIDRGAIMRWSREGLPAEVDPNDRATGSASPGAMGDAATKGVARAPTPAAPPAAEGAASASAVRLAIFVQDVAPNVPDQKVEVLGSMLGSLLSSPDVEVIGREVVLNAVSELASAGPNRGTGDPKVTEVQRLLSDQASALALSRMLGADGLILATIDSLTEDERRFDDPSIGTATTVVISTLMTSWSVVDGSTGGSVDSGMATARTQVRNTAELRRSPAFLDDLLRDASRQIAPSVQRALRLGARRPAAAATSEVAVRFGIEMLDMTVPEVVDRGGEWFITANRFPLVPVGCNVLVDGVLAGTAPGEVRMTRGPHRLRIERPGIDPVDQFIVAREGLAVTIPVQPDAAARRQWMEQATFFEALKDDAALREDQRTLIQGYAEFLRRSGVNVDTSSLQNLNIGGTTLWEQLLLP